MSKMNYQKYTEGPPPLPIRNVSVLWNLRIVLNKIRIFNYGYSGAILKLIS